MITDWESLLQEEQAKPYFQTLMGFLDTEKQAGHRIFPPEDQWYAALTHTPLTEVSVVILGQDPYHQAGQAEGIAFSVPPGQKCPPSLSNIHRAVANDLGTPQDTQTSLIPWAKQGVLLLNTVLTVRENTPNSHQHQGWEIFTQRVIETVSLMRSHCVFLLWGKQAGQYEALIDSTRHHILKSSHPSPLSAYRGFLSCRHFSQTNAYLMAHRKQTIDWTA
jgi:uracil-DNA glycosylase